MSKTAKWIIGILAALAIMAVFVGLGYLAYFVLNGSSMELRAQPEYFWGRRSVLPWSILPRPSTGSGVRPYEGFFSISRWLGIGGLLCMLLVLLLIAGTVALAFALGKRQKTAYNSGASPTQAPPPEAAPVALTCANCQHAVQADWKNCPYCGNPL